MTNVKLLKSIMILSGDTSFINPLSDLLGISKAAVSTRLRNQTEFTQSEILKIKDHYDLTSDDIDRIFIDADRNES